MYESGLAPSSATFLISLDNSLLGAEKNTTKVFYSVKNGWEIRVKVEIHVQGDNKAMIRISIEP